MRKKTCRAATNRLYRFNHFVVFGMVALFCAGTSVYPCSGQVAGPLLNTLFQDHVVVQRDAPVHLWGTAAPGETVTVELAGQTARTDAGNDGAWSARLPALPAGGPYTLTARANGGRGQTVQDVLVGDVFLCSGQSNMELQVSRSLNAPTEIRTSTNERIRLLRVAQAAVPSPQADFLNPVAWEKATPETVPNWSASCYYFARELQTHVDVPIGLIVSAWGGSDIRAWMNAKALGSVDGYREQLALLDQYTKDSNEAQATFGKSWESWWRAVSNDPAGAEPWQPAAGAAWKPAPETLGDWKKWGDPELEEHNGMVWFRGTFTLPNGQTGRDVDLSLGSIDEVDQTWINGQVVANTFGWGSERTYRIPARYLKAGENVVVVNVLSTWASGGLLGDPATRYARIVQDKNSSAGLTAPLGDWRYLKPPDAYGLPPRTPWESVGGRTTLYNAMIAPLRNLSLKGVVWYQGETNTGDGGAYLDLLRALMGQWRDQFGAGLPVLVVQLHNFGKQPTAPVESGWADVREAQRLATRDDPRAGLVVAIDLGDPTDIHPANKQVVGKRLARAARHVVYGEPVFPSGPVPGEVNRQNDSLAITFRDVDGMLAAYGNPSPIGFEVCSPAPKSCRYVQARIEGNVVRLPGGSDVTRVRYCWADSPVCTLYDTAGMPAGPFEWKLER